MQLDLSNRQHINWRTVGIGLALVGLGALTSALVSAGGAMMLLWWGPIFVGLGFIARGATDREFRYLAIAAAMLVLLILGLIAITMTKRSIPVLSEMGADFFTTSRWSPAEGKFGALAFVWGTLYTAIIAVLLAVPVSLGIALFITQVAPPWLKKPMVYVVDLLAVVPSVVFGLWGVLVLSDKIQVVYGGLHGIFAGIPGPVIPLLLLLGGGALLWTNGLRSVLGWVLANLGLLLLIMLLFDDNVPAMVFGDTPQGRSFATAGVILAIMIIPIITSLAREVIETTPPTDKEAALALGATRWEMITASVLPHSKGGLVGAVMLGLGRAMGETIAAALVIGSSLGQTTLNAFASGNSMPAVIANEWGEAESLHKSALIALAVTLFIITIAVNLVASTIVRRSMARTAGKKT
jgi:phosphate transport system permease protein